jgi:hypothetical protein
MGSMTSRVRHARRRVAGAAFATALIEGAALGFPAAAHAALSGQSTQLTRAPYLSDLTTASVTVNWGTAAQSRGTVQYGAPGNCTANSVVSAKLGSPITVNGVTEYQNSVTIIGLSANTGYCYRILTGGSSPVDLLGTNPSPAFTTLMTAGDDEPFAFGVMGDWGDTTDSGVNDGSLNANQAGVDAQIASSGVRFLLSAGDVAYQGGSATNYGDLYQTGADISAVFGPAYWAVPGMSVPVYNALGNHGLNATDLFYWPEANIAAGGVYGMVSYPSIDGSNAVNYPTNYYAFTTSGVRFYVLDASWGNSNIGTADGGTCGSHCAIYEVDHDAHWKTSSAEYQWLAADLAAHPGGVKIAVFHFPLRSDDATEPNDTYLDAGPGTSGTLEQLLKDGGVQLVFNGHAHDYQRNVAPPYGVVSYVSGGGGGSASSIGGHGCASTDAYAVGWSYNKSKGNACGAATAPASDSHVYHFLKVAVAGSVVTVMPTDSTGAVFDQYSYNLSADSTPPSAPGAPTIMVTSTKATLAWTAATDNVQLGAYDVYRNGTYLATVPPAALSYTDTTTGGTPHSYYIVARDLADNITTSPTST